jgi:hypothetical protein
MRCSRDDPTEMFHYLFRWVKQLAEHSGQGSDSSGPTPTAPELQADRKTASECPAGKVCSGLAPAIGIVQYRAPWQTSV